LGGEKKRENGGKGTANVAAQETEIQTVTEKITFVRTANPCKRTSIFEKNRPGRTVKPAKK